MHQHLEADVVAAERAEMCRNVPSVVYISAGRLPVAQSAALETRGTDVELCQALR